MSKQPKIKHPQFKPKDIDLQNLALRLALIANRLAIAIEEGQPQAYWMVHLNECCQTYLYEYPDLAD